MRKRNAAKQPKSARHKPAGQKPAGQLSRTARQWISGLKSSVSHLVSPAGPPPRLIFDQLEPRMLMSADPVVIDLQALQPTQPTHDVVVRLLNEVVTTGNQTTNIESVQTFDASNPATVLSSQIVPTGSNVTVLAGKGNDTITLDLSAAPASTTQPQFNVVGGGGNVSLGVIENASQSVSWHLDGGGAGQVDGPVQVGFTGVNHLLGGGADTLYGSATDTSWTVNGAGSGSVGTTQFSGFANLVGAAGQNDVFNITPTGSLTGSINAGGNGTVAVNAGAAESWQLDGDGAGQASGPVQIAFTGVDHLIGSGADTLYGATTDNNWTIDGTGSGEVGAISFAGFANVDGATGQNNLFTFTSTGSLAGHVDGGGDGTVAFDAGNADIVSTPSGAHSGTFAYGKDVISYLGMAPVQITNTGGTITLNLPSTSSTDHVELYYDTSGDARTGDMVLQSTDGDFELMYFQAPSTSVVINGTSGKDVLDIQSFDPSSAATITVNGTLQELDVDLDGTPQLTVSATAANVNFQISTNNDLLTPSSDNVQLYYDTTLKQMVLKSLSGDFGTVSFAAPTSNLSINVPDPTNVDGGGGSGDDTLTIMSLAPGFAASLNVNLLYEGFDPFATGLLPSSGPGAAIYQNSIYVDGDLDTNGGSVNLVADNTYVGTAGAAEISTVNANGNAGAITLGMVGTNTVPGGALVAGGTYVDLGSGAILDAQANGKGGKAGAITVATSDIGQRLVSAPVDYTNKNANIVIDGATIEGGSITISATASDTNLTTDAPSNLSGFTGNLGTLLNQIPGVALSSFLGIDASVILRGATATINITDATIISSNTVSIKAAATVTTQVSAITEGVGAVATATGVSFAAGYGQAIADAEVNIKGSTSITAAGSVTIAATGKSSDSVQAYADSNLFTDVNPNAVSIALAAAYNDLTALATVGADSSITSTTGNINVTASGSQTTKPDARTYSPIDGAGGVAVGLDWETADVEANVSGTLTTLAPEGSVGVDNSEAQTFTGASIGPDGMTITIPDNGFSTGELVVYQPEINAGTSLLPIAENGGTAIGGLTAGSTYTVLVVGPNEIQLTKAAPLDIAAIGTSSTSQQTLNVVATTLFSTDAIDSSNDIIIPGHGFTTGDRIQYSDGGNTPIAGLTNNAIYTVNVVDDQTFQLEDSSGNVVQISQVDQSGDIALGTQSFTDLTNTTIPTATVTLAYIDTKNNAIDVEGIGNIFASGKNTEVNYESLADDGANSIVGLTNEAFYDLKLVNANSFQLYDESTNQVVQLGDPGGPATQALSFISNVVTFNPIAVQINPNTNTPVDSNGSAVSGGVDSTTDDIVIPNASLIAAGLPNGLANGTPIIYEVDQSVQTTEALTFELNAITANTIYLPSNGLSNGAMVTYDPGVGNTAITGLNTTDTYEVMDVNPTTVDGVSTSDSFQLFDVTTNQMAHISQGNALGTQTFTDNADMISATITLALVDTSTNTIEVSGHGFTGTTGTPTDVNYAVLNGSNIGGLTDGGEYNLVATGANTFQLYDGKTLVSLSNLTGPSVSVIAAHDYYVASGFVPGQAASGSSAFELDAINSTNNTIYIAGNQLVNGGTVTYDAGKDNSGNPNTPIAGLTQGASYTVVDVTAAGVVDPTLTTSDYFMLIDASGKVANVSQGTALGTQTFTDATNDVSASVNLAYISGNVIHVEDHGFTGTMAAPQVLNYEALAGAGIGGLTSGGTYGIVSTGTNTFQIVNSTTNAVVTITDAGTPTANAITNMNGQGSLGDLTTGDVAISGLVSDTTYYVVTAGFDAQGDQLIRLVDDPSEIANDEPIALTANGGQYLNALSTSPLTDGIGVTATLTSANTVKVQPQIGGKFNKETGFKNAFSRADLGLATLFGSAQAQSGSGPVEGPAEQNGKPPAPVSDSIHNDSLSLGGGVGITVTHNTVNAQIGNAGSTKLVTPNNVTVSATDTQTDQAIVQSDVSKPKTSTGGAAVDLAFAVGVFNNAANANVFGDASIDAGNTVTISSSLMYPFLTDPSELTSLQGIGNLVVSQGTSFVTTDLLDGTFGAGTLFLNDWVVARAKAQGSQAAAFALSIAVDVYTNKANAIVMSGAQINQNMNSIKDPADVALADQSVAVTATIGIDLLEMAGIGKWSLSDAPIAKKFFEKKTASQLWDGGDIIDIYGRSGSKSIGGSVLLDDINDNAFAEIEGDAKVTTGAQGSLTLTSTENIFRIAIATAGGQTGNGASFGFAGSGLFTVQTSNIQAGLVANTSGGPTVAGGGTLTINATSGGFELDIAGAIVDAGKGSDALGVSLLINDVTTNVYAFIGEDPSSDPTDDTSTGAVSLDVGDTSLSATTDGTWISVVATATVLSGPSITPTQASVDPLSGVSLPAGSSITSGSGLAGSVGINVFNEDDLAYINATGSVTTGTLSLDAELTPVIVMFSGGVAASVTGGGAGGGGKVIGGSVVFNQITADTEAFIADFLGASGLTVRSTAPNAAGNQVSLTATRGGTLGTFSAAVAANTNTMGNAYSGSASVNRLVDTTKTLIEGASLIAAGSTVMKALDEAQVIAIGGGASYTAGARGVGASLAYNQIDGDTESGVLGVQGRRASVDIGGSLSITAMNDQTLWAFAISLGIATGGGATSNAVAFTLGMNVISTSQTIFTRANSSGILAQLQNADITASGVSIEADDNSVIYAVAGAIGVGAQGSAYGVGLGWNQIALVVEATIDNSTVTASSGGISLQALSTENGPITNIGDTDPSFAGKIAAAAIGGSKGNGTSVGGSLSVNGTYDTIEATVTNGSILTTTAGSSISILASDQSTINALTGGAALSSTGSAVGAAIAGNYIANDVTANVDSSTVTSGGNFTLDGEESAAINSITIGAAGGDNVSVGASVSINVIDDPVTSSITGASADVFAFGNLRVIAQDTADIVALAGGLALGGKTGVGLSITNVTILDTTNAFIDGAATASADGDLGTFTDVLGDTYQGLSIEANASENIVILAVGGAFSTEGAGTGAATLTYIDVSASAYEMAPSASPGANAGISSLQDVDIAARGHTTLVGVAGALSGSSGDVAVGIGADAGYIDRNIEAYIGAGASATAGDNVVVAAYADMTQTSVSASGAFSSETAVTLTAGIAVLDLTTLAYIGSGATVTSNGNVLVTAEDDTTENQVSGNIAGSGNAAVGIAAGVGVLTKDTEAYIATGASVTALANEAAIKANAGNFSAPQGGTDAQQTGDTQEFAASAVDYVNSTFDVPNHGFTAGEEVVYTGESLPIDGLETGEHYFIAYIDADHFALATTQAAALSNDPSQWVQLTDNGLSPTSDHVIETLNNTGVPSINNQAFNDPSLTEKRERTPTTSMQTGLIVVAVSVNDMTSAGVGVAISGSGSGAVAGSVTVNSITTLAYIDQGAQINAASNNETTAGVNQNVTVAAGRSYNDLSIGVGIAGSADFAAAPGFAAPVLEGSTEAFIQGTPSGSGTSYSTFVQARGNVAVEALALETILSIGSGIALSGDVGIGGSAAVVDINTTTLASISGLVRVSADGNVVVTANDDTTSYTIGGAVGIGLATAGGAGAVNVTSITKLTEATISDEAIVDAQASNANAGNISNVPDGTLTGNTFNLTTSQGVAVLAGSSEDVTSVAGSAGGGLYAGIAGAASVELIDSSTLATLGTGVHINQNSTKTTGTSQSVVVAATNQVNVLSIAGALGVGGAGIGASVDVGMITNNTQALVGAGAQIAAKKQVDVYALSNWAVNSNAISFGAGIGGIGGGIIVYTIGGDFNSQYSTSSGSSSALSGKNSSVISFVDATVSTLSGRSQTDDASTTPTFNPSSAVNSTTHTIDLGSDPGFSTGDTVVYSDGGGTPIDHLVNGQTYFVIVNPNNPDDIQLASSYENAQDGVAIAIDTSGTTGSAHQLQSGNAGLANAGRATAAANSSSGAVDAATNGAAPPSGTTAGINGGTSSNSKGAFTTITSPTVSVEAVAQLNFTGIAGGAGVGAVALGVGIGVVHIDIPAVSYISSAVTLLGENASGDLTVIANLTDNVSLLGFAGALSGFVSLAGAVSFVTDSSTAVAMIGAFPESGNGTLEAASSSLATTIGGFDDVDVASNATIAHFLSDGAASVSGVAGLGAAVVSDTVTGVDQAVVGDFTQIGTSTSSIAGTVKVDAERTVTLNPYNNNLPMGIAIGGGAIVGAAAGVALISVTGTVTARVGDDAGIYAAGAVTINGTSTITASNMEIDGAAIGAIAVGFVIAQATFKPTVDTTVGKSTVVRGSSVTITANNAANGSLLGVAAGGGILSGQGLDIEMEVDPTTSILVDQDADITAIDPGNGFVNITSTANATSDATGNAGNYGGVEVIVGGASSTLDNVNTVTIGSDAVISAATTVTVLATSTNDAESAGDAGGDGLVAINEASTTTNESDQTLTTVDSGASLTSGTDMSVEARTSTTGKSTPTASAGGLGVNTGTTANLTYGGSTITEIQSSADLTSGDNLAVLARVTTLDIEVNATSTSSALGADSSADGTIARPSGTPTSDAEVNVRSGADLTADNDVTIKASHESVTSNAVATATTNGLGADTSTTTNNDFDVATRVLTETNSVIHARALEVDADADSSPTGFSDATSNGAVIDVGGQNSNQTLNYPRTINFNSTVFLAGAAVAGSRHQCRRRRHQSRWRRPDRLFGEQHHHSRHRQYFDRGRHRDVQHPRCGHRIRTPPATARLPARIRSRATRASPS